MDIKHDQGEVESGESIKATIEKSVAGENLIGRQLLQP